MIVGLLLACSGVARAATSCDQAGRAAEQAYGVPPGLLLAIGKVESGRWDDATGKVIAWPWSVDIDGAPHFYDSPEAALRQVRAQAAGGGHSIDVGCFQINLGWHGGAFESLEQAFDPVANANYAASFLRSLNVRLGSWTEAVAAYHSANPELARPYRNRVLAAWSPEPPPSAVWQPVMERFGVRVWTPTASISIDPRVERSAASESGGLPRIITPAQR